MASQPTTLRHVLTQAKPSLRRTWTKPFPKNTTHRDWPELDSISIWDEFNLTNLNDSYGPILDLFIPDRLSPKAEEMFADVVLAKAGDICHLIRWHSDLVGVTVRFAKQQLGLHPSIVLGQKYTPVDQSVTVRLPGAPRVVVNHIISLDDYPELFLVVSYGRESTRWSGRELARQLNDPTSDLTWPLRQLANICKAAKTRYGYIQTDEEIVVCRFSKSADEHFKVKFMPVPWTKNGVNALTSDLALWWLCMLAMSGSEHCDISSEGEIVEINEWDILYLGENHGWIRRHRYSNLEQRISTPPPPSYTTPSPGNTAALMAGVNVQDIEWHNFDNSDDFLNIQLLDAANATDSASANF